MSFLGLAFLAALPLAALPVLLHLYDRHRRVVVEWGAMQFLVEAARRRTSARRLRELILLLLRTLAILCLVLALARPLIHSRWLSATDRGETILVIDNSLSMTRSNDGKSLFESAVASAEELLETLPRGDTVRVLVTSPYPIWLMSASQRTNSDVTLMLKEQLQDQQPTLGRSDLLGSLFAAVQADVSPGTKHRHVIVFTDGQRTDWSLNEAAPGAERAVPSHPGQDSAVGDTPGWQRLSEVLRAPLVPTDLKFVFTGTSPSAGSNLAVRQIRLNRTTVGVDQPVTLTAEVQNYGPMQSDPSSLRWTVGNDEVHRSQVPGLAPGEVFDVVWNHSFSSLGVFAVAAELVLQDVLPGDNRGTVIVEVVDRIPILLVEGSPNATDILQDSFLVQTALGWMDGEPLESRGVHLPTVVTPDQLQRFELKQYQAVLIPNVADVGEAVARKLQSFVFEGGGLWMALGPRTDIERFNQYLFADANGLSPLAVDRIVDESGTGTSKTLIDPTGMTHPATRVLADTSKLDLGRIIVSRRCRFAAPAPGESVSVLLPLTNGEPLAIEKQFGRGRVIVQAVPLRLQWSELARSQAFVVIVQEWLSYLTLPQATRHNLQPGEPISLHLPGSEAREATLRTPQGLDVELTAELSTDGVLFRTARTIQPGDYSLEVGLSGDRIPFHVHRDPGESDLGELNANERERLANLSTVGTVAAGTTADSSVPADPVWPLLLALMIVLIPAELFLSGQLSRLRFGNDPIAEATGHLADDPSAIPVFTSRGSRPIGGARSESAGHRTPVTSVAESSKY